MPGDLVGAEKIENCISISVFYFYPYIGPRQMYWGSGCMFDGRVLNSS
jgi:hypothetical protein